MSNERIIAPELTIDAIDMPAVESPLLVEEAGFTYQRADGTVERALNVKDAVSRCPVLGKLALEAPNEVGILLELAAAGNRKMAANDRDEQSKFKLKEKQEVSPMPETLTADIQAEKQQIPNLSVSSAKHIKNELQLASPSIVSHLHVELIKQQVQDKNLRVRTDTAVTQEAIESQDAEVTQQTMQPEVYAASKIEAARQLDTSRTELVTLAQPVEVKIQQRQQSEVDTMEPTAIEIKPVEKPASTADFKDEDYNGLNIVINDIGEEIKVDIDNQLELLFEPETVEAYEQLIALITDTETDSSVDIETQVEAVLDLDLEPESKIETASITDFETFISMQPAAEESITLESIRDQADEQPFEQTLTQLAEHLLETFEESEQGSTLQEIIYEIEKALPACHKATEAGPEPQITPEITEKLLILLRELGYHNPKDILVNFVSAYSLGFLLSALEYICQLNLVENRKEFLSGPATPVIKDDTTRKRVSKALFSLITGSFREPILGLSAAKA